MKYHVTLTSDHGEVVYQNETVTFIADRDSENASCALTLTLPDWTEDTYLFVPAAVYNGNKMRRVKRFYPPMYEAEECGVKPEPLITNLPALEPDGSGRIEISAGDCALPCVGVFDPHGQRALLLFCTQQWKERNVGFCLERGRITVQYPVLRSECYMMCKEAFEPTWDRGEPVQKGETVSVPLRILTLSCRDLPQFFELYFQNRHRLYSDPPASNGYTQALWDTMEEYFNRENWSGEFYGLEGAGDQRRWAAGWCGGGMSSLALWEKGTPTSRERAIQTVDYMTAHRTPRGFFCTRINDGTELDDGFDRPHMRHAILMRRQGDALYFLLKQIEQMPPKQAWLDAARACADALTRLYERYGDFGQFVHGKTGEMLFGGTTSGASCIGALARAGQCFGDNRYLDVAKASGERYYRDFVAKGWTYGGPGEALCAPDSETSYAMVESMVLLYEATGEERWLTYAKDSTHLFSTWVMAYSYRFPAWSELARLGVNTVGSVFANVQNKHSAPGICTASGDALYRLWRYTGNQAYLSLLRDIAYFLPQCVSTKDRPIETWHKSYPTPEPARTLPSGWICERVNTSDWERPWRVGGVFYGSCWCETSVLLSFCELMEREEIALAIQES